MQSSIWYLASYFVIFKGTFQNVKTLAWNFVWGGMPNEGTKVKVSWDMSTILSNVKGIVKIFDLEV
jgi:hypothetical protein